MVPVLLASNGDAMDTPASNQVVKRVKNFIVDYYLPLLSLLSMVIGYFYPQPGLYLANRNCASLSTTGVFIVSGEVPNHVLMFTVFCRFVVGTG